MNTLPLDISGRGSAPADAHLTLEQFLQEQDQDSPLKQYLNILFRQRWIVLAIMAAGVLSAVFINATTVKLYRSTGSIEIEREAARVVNTDDSNNRTTGGPAAMEFYQTQYGLLHSRALAEQVVQSLRLADNPTFMYGYSGRKAPAGGMTGDRRQRELGAAGLLLAHLTVDPVRGSSLVSLSFDSPDPALSATIINAIAKNFIASSLNRRIQATAYARTFLQQQIEATRQKLEASERALVAYAGQERIITYEGSNPTGKPGDSSAGQSVVSTDLRALNDALNAAKIDRAQAEARFRQAAVSGGKNAPESLSDATINQLRASRASLQAEYQKLSATFRPDYPQMVALRQQIAEIDKQLNTQGSVVLDSLRAAFQAAVERQNDLQRQVDVLKNNVIAQRGRSVEYNTLQRDADANRAAYDALLQQYKEISISANVGTNNVSVVDAALPGGQVTPRTTMNLLLGLLLGALVGAAVAFLLEQLDESIIAPHDLERKLGVPLLGSIPRVPDSELSLDLLDDSKTPMAEAYLSLQTALRLTTAKGAPRVLFVTSSRPSEGKSTTAMAVARNFAGLGRKTILIDGDLRNPSVHKMLGFANAGGLTNILAGAEDPAPFVRPGPVDRLSVMSSGPIPPNPAELLAGPALSELFTRLLGQYEHIVVDGPPVLGLADAPLIASYAEGTMFVVAAKNTHTRTARMSLRRLADVHANILGAVLTKFDAKKVGYTYGYDYEYGEKRIGFMKRATG